MKISFDNCSARPIYAYKHICAKCHFIHYAACPGMIASLVCRDRVFIECEKSDIFNL